MEAKGAVGRDRRMTAPSAGDQVIVTVHITASEALRRPFLDATSWIQNLTARSTKV